MAPHSLVSRPHSTKLITLIGLSFGLLAVPGLAVAQNRADLSRGLAKQIQAGAERVQVIYEGPQAEVERLAQAYGLRVAKRLPGGAVFSGSGQQFDALAQDAGVGSLSQDELVMGMSLAAQSTGASQLFKTFAGNYSGLVGRGIGVAVIDSGIAAHSDLRNRILYSANFTDEPDGDLYGHGTHVAGIIGGSGFGSRVGRDSQHVGMAPGASLISLKVLGADGTGYVSDVIEAIEWTIRNRERYGIRVLNLSLGHPASGSYANDPMAKAVERAVAAGIVVIASAGNLGKLPDGTPLVGAIVSPGYTPGALTVGALNTRGTVSRSDDGVATFSSRGPVGDEDQPGTWELKPDLVAPGNAVISAGAEGSYLWNTYPQRRVAGGTGGSYLTLSGSSMAAAVVSGAVAQLPQAEPDMTPAQVKFALQY